MTQPYPVSSCQARRRPRWRLAGLSMLLALAPLLCLPTPAVAWELQGSKALRLHSRDGQSVLLGQVNFEPRADGRIGFALALRTEVFKDYFLSMKEFKCVEGADEIFCHVPYPYAQPGSVTPTDLAWLEHSLLFLFKKPNEFGARLWNGVYFRLQRSEQGLVGTPQAIDLNLISAPPAQAGGPPYRPALRDDIAPEARWFNRLSIE
ncbi:MAG: hypothetical protein AB9M60_23790 [Leptothrix sp. (in: b-proteobacteria)]